MNLKILRFFCFYMIVPMIYILAYFTTQQSTISLHISQLLRNTILNETNKPPSSQFLFQLIIKKILLCKFSIFLKCLLYIQLSQVKKIDISIII